MMKIYYFVFIRLSRLVALYNNIKKHHREDGRFLTYYYLLLDNDLAGKKNHKFSSLVFIARLNVKCTKVKNHFHI